MKCHSTLLAVVTALLSIGSTHASENSGTACVIPSNLPPSPTAKMWEGVRTLLAGQLQNCLNNSDYFALYGASLLYSGDTPKAIEMLERALLIDPYNGSARVDYAQALYQSGQLLPAIQVNRQLLNEPNMPAPLKEALEKRQKAWESRQHLWRNQFSYLFGHSSNLNNATYIEDYELTYLDGTVLQTITQDSQARSGSYHYLNFTSQYFNLTTSGTSLLTLSAKTRESELTNSDTDEFKLTYEREQEGRRLRNNWSISAEHLRLGDEGLFSALEGNYRIHPQQSISYLNFESRYAHFNGNDLLDEAALIISPGLVYTHEDSRFGIEVGLGFNKALDDRFGGDRTTQEATVFYDFALFEGRFTSRVSYTHTEDQDGYSVLLENNAPRETQAISASLQYFYPVNSDFTIHSSYYYRDQDSNIDLFKTKHESIDLGFTYRF